MLHTAQCILHTVHFTLHTAHCTLNTEHCKMQTAHCTLYTVHYKLHTANYTLQTAHCTLNQTPKRERGVQKAQSSAPPPPLLNNSIDLYCTQTDRHLSATVFLLLNCTLPYSLVQRAKVQPQKLGVSQLLLSTTFQDLGQMAKCEVWEKKKKIG